MCFVQALHVYGHARGIQTGLSLSGHLPSASRRRRHRRGAIRPSLDGGQDHRAGRIIMANNHVPANMLVFAATVLPVLLRTAPISAGTRTWTTRWGAKPGKAEAQLDLGTAVAVALFINALAHGPQGRRWQGQKVCLLQQTTAPRSAIEMKIYCLPTRAGRTRSKGGWPRPRPCSSRSARCSPACDIRASPAAPSSRRRQRPLLPPSGRSSSTWTPTRPSSCRPSRSQTSRRRRTAR